MFSINTKIAPKEWVKFKRWHTAACSNDPLSAEERFKSIGGKLPKNGHKKVSK